jgi:integrase/recombinase XerC
MEIDSFLHYLEYEKRYSAHTIIGYKTDLEQFERFVQEMYNLSLIKAEYPAIRSWIVSLIDQKIDPRSVKRKISALRTFYKFLLRTGKIPQNPTLKIKVPKTSRKLPVFLSQDKLNNYLDSFAAAGSFTLIRDLLILELFYCTGIRLAELLSLKDYNVDLYNCTVKVLGKRNKERLIPFTSRMKELFCGYIDLKSSVPANSEGFLFISENGSAMYPKQVYRIVKEHLAHITTLDKKSPHILRHTFATDMLNSGADINAIKELLGHSSLAATQVYTHNSIDKLKNIYKQAHPRA